MMPNADDLDVMCICRRPEYRSTTDHPSLWETNRLGEKIIDCQQRHHQARILCLSCPMLDACETELSRLERSGEPVDGVMAGRYGDVPILGDRHTFTTTVCGGCAEQMIPQRKNNQPAASDDVRHVGEGLCSECHPRYSRQARQARKTTRRAA